MENNNARANFIFIMYPCFDIAREGFRLFMYVNKFSHLGDTTACRDDNGVNFLSV